MRNKCSWFIEVALFFCSAVTGDAFPDPRGRNKRGEVWTCRCDWLSRYLQLYNGRRTVKNSFTKYNIHSICDWGGLLKDKFVIWQYSLVLPRCSCIFIRLKEYTSLICYNTSGIYSVVRHPRKRDRSLFSGGGGLLCLGGGSIFFYPHFGEGHFLKKKSLRGGLRFF